MARAVWCARSIIHSEAGLLGPRGSKVSREPENMGISVSVFEGIGILDLFSCKQTGLYQNFIESGCFMLLPILKDLLFVCVGWDQIIASRPGW